MRDRGGAAPRGCTDSTTLTSGRRPTPAFVDRTPGVSLNRERSSAPAHVHAALHCAIRTVSRLTADNRSLIAWTPYVRGGGCRDSRRVPDRQQAMCPSASQLMQPDMCLRYNDFVRERLQRGRGARAGFERRSLSPSRKMPTVVKLFAVGTSPRDNRLRRRSRRTPMESWCGRTQLSRLQRERHWHTHPG